MSSTNSELNRVAESQVPKAILLLHADLGTRTEQSCDATGQKQGALESVQLWMHLQGAISPGAAVQCAHPLWCADCSDKQTADNAVTQYCSSKTKPQKLVYNHKIGVFPSFRKLC